MKRLINTPKERLPKNYRNLLENKDFSSYSAAGLRIESLNLRRI